MRLVPRLGLAAIITTCLAFSARPADPVQLLQDFVHYSLTANVELAQASGDALLDSGVSDQELAEIVDDDPALRDRLIRAYRWGREVPALEQVSGQIEKRVEMGRLEQAREEIKALQAELLGVNHEMEHLREIAASERPLRGQKFHMKTSERGNPVPDNIRDLLVNFRTQLGLAGEKSLEAAQMTLEAIGAKVQGRIKKHDALALSNACLVETALMMEDDQYRRMAEELREGPEREIRVEKWTAAEQNEAERVEQAGIAAHKSAVLDNVEGWLHNPRYKPKDLPDPGDIDVGDPAATGEDFELALCALLFMGMDATTHARCESPHLPSGPLALVSQPTTLSLLRVGTTGPSSLPTSAVTQARRTMASLRS